MATSVNSLTVMTSEEKVGQRTPNKRQKVSGNWTRYHQSFCLLFALVCTAILTPTTACLRSTCPAPTSCNETTTDTTSTPDMDTRSPGLSCRPGSFECQSQCACVPLDWVCDGRSDCQDGSDEFPANCRLTTARMSTTTASTPEGYSTIASTVSVRLVNGTSTRQGVVEIDWHGTPTYICVHKQGWNNIEAGVVCRMLGYGGYALATSDASFPRRVDMGETVQFMRCNGSESSIAQCRLTWDSACYMGNREIASVTCGANVNVDLVGAGSASAGAVRVVVDGVPGTICNEGMLWNDAEAKVICHMLGYNTSDAQALHSTAFHAEIGDKVWASTLWCDGTESHILDCRSEYRWELYRCSSQASVICNTEMEVSLRGGSDTRGTAELRVAGAPGYFCAGGVSPGAAQVMCRMLGKSGGVVLSGTAVSHGLPRGEGVPWLAGLTCTGSEQSIENCPRSPLGRPYCTSDQAMAIECS